MLQIQEHINLAPYNSFGIHAKAKWFIEIRSENDLVEALSHELIQQNKAIILGGGSNVLFLKNLERPVIKISIKGIEVIGEDNLSITIRVGAGENWHSLVDYCINQGWGGLENLSLIPGTVGAAPMQNIGAYGKEVKENIIDVEGIYAEDLQSFRLNNKDCKFGYRESIFKHELKDKCIITYVSFRLSKVNHQYNTSYGAIEQALQAKGMNELSLRAISDAVISIRQSKLPDPAQLGNAGSFFKNPNIPDSLYAALQKNYPDMPGFPDNKGFVKVPAAWLIEKCGWKGKRFGAVGVHDKQALVLVNYGGGSGEELWSLAMKIKASVAEKFSVELSPEVNIIN